MKQRQIAVNKKEQTNKVENTYLIRRSIIRIFFFSSIIIMISTNCLLVYGLCTVRLLRIIDEGARPPTLLNIAILAEAGSTISLDSVAQAHNDLLIAKSFTELILEYKVSSQLSQRRQLQDEQEAGLGQEATEFDESQPSESQQETITGENTEDQQPESNTLNNIPAVKKNVNDAEEKCPGLTIDEKFEDYDNCCQNHEGQSAIPYFEIEGANWCDSNDINYFYSHGSHTSRQDWSEAHAQDFEICEDLLFLVKDFLGYPYLNFPKVRGYIGFESGALCGNPTTSLLSLNEKSDEYKENCDDQSGYYNSYCRPWYIEQKLNQEKAVMIDLYPDAVSQELMSSICIDVSEPITGNYYGAICLDVDMIQFFFESHQQKNMIGPTIYQRPVILQLDNEKSIDHLSENIFRAKVEDWRVKESTSAVLYGDFGINVGIFEVPAWTNEANYTSFDEQSTYGIQTEKNDKKMQKGFFIFSNLNFNNLEQFTAQQDYQFFIFNLYTELEKLDEMEDHLFITVFRFWFPYLILGSIMYLVIIRVLINYTATNLTNPFLELSEKIRLNVKNVQKTKLRSQKHERGGKKKSLNQIELQVDLLKGYKPINKETNQLFLNFNNLAKILFVGQASSQSEFSYQAFFDLQAAAELLKDKHNIRGAGACYMILGIKLATQSDHSYFRAVEYMKLGEKLQSDMIKEATETQDGMNQMQEEDVFILSFRQYTHAIISYNFYVKMDEESHHKYLYHADRRIDFMRQYDGIGLNALEYFEKCLLSCPDPNLTLNQQRHETLQKLHRQSTKKSDKEPLPSEHSSHIGIYCDGQQNSPKTLQQALVAKLSGLQKDQTEPNVVMDIELGQITALKDKRKVMGRKSFEDATDIFLLGEKSPVPQAREAQSPYLMNTKNSGQNVQQIQLIQPARQYFSNSSGTISQSDLDRSQSVSSSDDSPPRINIHSASSVQNSFEEGEDDQPFDLQSFRDFSEKRVGQKREAGRDNDGFADFKIFIKLLVCELKILLLPVYLKSKSLSSHEHDESHLGAGGQSHHYQSFNSDSFQQSSSGSSEESEQLSQASPEMRRRASVYTSVTNKDRQKRDHDDKLKLYEKFFKCQKSTLSTPNDAQDNQDEDQLIDQLLASLQQKIKCYSSRRLTKIKRMGLPKFKKSFLVQNYYYLMGLRYYALNNKQETNYSNAIHHFLNSVRCSHLQVNDLSKKTFLKLNHILMLLYEKKFMLLVKCSAKNSIQQFINSKQYLPRKLTRVIQRRITSKHVGFDKEMFLAKQQSAQSLLNRNTISMPYRSRQKSTLAPYSPRRSKPINKINETKGNNFRQRQTFYPLSKVESVDESIISEVSSNSKFSKATQMLHSKTQKDQKKNTGLNPKEDLRHSLDSLKNNLLWVKLQLSHHVVSQRSICFVLDTAFDHYKQQQMCKELILETFVDLDDDDHFGLILRQDEQTDYNYQAADENQKKHIDQENFDILLEEKGSNASIKNQVLKKLLEQENIPQLVKQGSDYMRQFLEQAVNQTKNLPEKTVKFQELELVSPIKWIVCFVGSLKGLRGMKGMPKVENTNILIVYVTDDEEPRYGMIEQIKEEIKKLCSQGGLMIIRYNATTRKDQAQLKNRDLMTKAMQRIKSMIAHYPSKNIPIIQENLEL